MIAPTEGVDRCACGAKYWDGDVCHSCGETFVVDTAPTPAHGIARPSNPLRLGAKKCPTRKHRVAVWENMLGTVYARNASGEVRYFDYRWDDAVAFAELGDDLRTWKVDRRDWRKPNYRNERGGPSHGQKVLWTR